jgi:two-component system chemotaxis sensor kinase CheA
LQVRVERLECDPVSMRFFRAGEQAKRLARRLGKPEPNILIDANDVRLPPDVWAPFWVAFTHVVQNAVDHGLESEKERSALGKPGAGTLRFSAHSSSTGCQIVFEDDGSGVDWEKVRTRARALGLPADTENDLAAALFADSLSTKDIATATSGRGVGLAAVKSATQALDGRVHVESTRGSGTRFTFEFALLDAAERRSGQRVAAGTSGPRLGRQV